MARKRKKGKRNRNFGRGSGPHSEPMVAVQVPDIGMGVPGIEWFCNNPNHHGCVKELDQAFHDGGFVVASSFWAKKYRS